MKYITLFLLAALAHADIYMQRVTSEQTDHGYIFQFVQNGISYCWAMPQMLDQSFIPPIWTKVTQAAIDYRWPVMTDDAAIACLTAIVPRTIENASWGYSYLYAVSIAGGVMQIGAPIEIPANTPCGDKVSATQYKIFALHSVTSAGNVGMAVCR